MAEEKIVLTREGLEKLEAEYRYLIDVERPEVIEQLRQARGQGDLSENADYDAARDKQAKIESRISEIEHIRDIAVIVEHKSGGKKINLGYFVTFHEVEGDKKGPSTLVKIVGTIEANPRPGEGKTPSVSDQSALGKALIGHSAGDRVTVECEEPYEVEIEKAELARD